MGEPENQGVLDSYSNTLRAIGSVVLPYPEALDDEGWAEAERIIEGALAPKPPGIKRQIRLFLRVANILPVFSTGRPLVKLPLKRRSAFLEKLQRSRLMPLSMVRLWVSTRMALWILPRGTSSGRTKGSSAP